MLSKHADAVPVKHTVSSAAPARCALLLVASILIAACTTTTAPPVSRPDQGIGPDGTGAELLSQAGAATGERAARLYLEATRAFLAVADYPGAALAFAALEPGWLARRLLPEYHLLAARMALVRGDLQEARLALGQLPADYRQSPEGLLLESEICAAAADYLCALEQLLLASGDTTAHNELIWSYLDQAVSIPALSGRPNTEPENPRLDAWQALHRLVVTSFSTARARRDVDTWLAAHPQHPAALSPPEAIRRLDARRPVRIGLLLPLSGPLARAGEVLRDGFVAAMLMGRPAAMTSLTGDGTDLFIYDSAAEPIPILYERVLADGVDLLVGPLDKESVTTLNGLRPNIPALVLNYLDTDTVPSAGVMQIGLAIEDEAATIARRLGDDGVSSALVFHNYEDWSQRARRTLAESTGASLTVQPFTDMRTITEAVGTAMHVTASQARREQLAGVLGLDLEFLPRARQDVDAVVALIDNGEANALVPALRFHFADHLPVYASSQVTRRSRTRNLGELGGFHVSELPWFLEDDPVYAALRTPFALDTNPFASLVALGADAYRIAERAPVSRQPGPLIGSAPPPPAIILLGSTGLLRMGPDGRVGRELAWGRIERSRIVRDVPATTQPAQAAGGAP